AGGKGEGREDTVFPPSSQHATLSCLGRHWPKDTPQMFQNYHLTDGSSYNNARAGEVPPSSPTHHSLNRPTHNSSHAVLHRQNTITRRTTLFSVQDITPMTPT
ncbi:unnamed protein product, partial [Ectocarpus sp. 4 AP-2014]